MMSDHRYRRERAGTSAKPDMTVPGDRARSRLIGTWYNPALTADSSRSRQWMVGRAMPTSDAGVAFDRLAAAQDQVHDFARTASDALLALACLLKTQSTGRQPAPEAKRGTSRGGTQGHSAGPTAGVLS